jgi:hypothetical protein
MKKLFLILSIFVLFISIEARAQAGSLPTATVHQASLSWTNACASGVTCTFNVYRCTGAAASCPTTGTSWTLLTTTALTGTIYVDTAVTQNTTYSYVVYALASGDTAGPSNEASGTIPLGPTAPTGVTVTVQ